MALPASAPIKWLRDRRGLIEDAEETAALESVAFQTPDLPTAMAGDGAQRAKLIARCRTAPRRTIVV